MFLMSSGCCRGPCLSLKALWQPVSPRRSVAAPAAAAADPHYPRAANESHVHKPEPQNSVVWLNLILYNILQ